MPEIQIKVGGDGTGFFALQNKIEARVRASKALMRAMDRISAEDEIREIKRVASVEEASRRNRARALMRERAEKRQAAAEAAAIARRAAAPPVIKPPIIAGSAIRPSIAGQLGSQFAGAATGQLAGFLSFAALSEATRRTITFGSSIKDLHETTGASIRSLQEWNYAASKNGATLDDVGLAFKGLAKARDEALRGDEEKLAAFGLVGISREQLQTNSIDQSMRQVADAFNKFDFGADAEPLAEKLLGRGGVSMIATFKDDFRALADEAQKLNAILADDTVKELSNIANEVVKIVAQFRGPFASAVLFVARVIGAMANMLAAQAKMLGHMSVAAFSNPLTKNGRTQFREAMKLAFEEAQNASPLKALKAVFNPEEKPEAGKTNVREAKVGFIPKEGGSLRERDIKDPFSITADGVTKIGGFVGGTNPGIIADILGRQQLTEQQKIARNTAELLAWMKSRNFSVDDGGSL